MSEPLSTRTASLLLGVALVRGLWAAYTRRSPLMVDGWRLGGLAYADGVHDDTRALQMAMDTGGRTKLDAGTFKVTFAIVVKNCDVHGAGLAPGEARLTIDSDPPIKVCMG